MSTILDLKAARRTRVAELVAGGMTNTEAWEAVADLTDQIAAARAATFTASAETAARMAEKQVVGLSIRGEDLPAPVPASQHVSIMESQTHPGVVWPL